MWLGPSPAEADVLVDAQYGFLHRVTALVDGRPFKVEEFLGLVLNPPIDEAAFRIDESKVRVIDPTDWKDPNLPARVWNRLTRPYRNLNWNVKRHWRRQGPSRKRPA